jgi:catechol 2,3-dioxygenase-like lactoylglutathione lyase family enzyme
MITGMQHVGISVSDIERSIAFYTEVFGMELLGGGVFPFEGPLFEQVMALEGARGRLCMLRRGSLQVELFEFEHPRPKPKDPDYPVADRGISHFCVAVDDIDATYAAMTAAGVRFHCPVLTFVGGIRATYGRDPDGNVFELIEGGVPA